MVQELRLRRRKGKTKACRQCSASFYVRPAYERIKFCSRACYEASRSRPAKVCPVCDVSFSPKNCRQQTCSYRCSKTGTRNPLWAGGESRPTARALSAAREWRDRVFRRDKFTCRLCSAVGGKLRAHHKDAFHWCAARRYDIKNGVTLCDRCHVRFHRACGYRWNTEKQFREYAGAAYRGTKEDDDGHTS